MGTLMASLAFAAFVVAQIAAVVAVHAERNTRRTKPSDAPGLGCQARQIQLSAD